MAVWILVSIVVGLGGAILIAHRGYYWGLNDDPNVRSSHRISVPRGGGIGILAIFVVSSIWWGVSWIIWIPVFLVSLISLQGDHREISFKFRLAVQVGSAAIICGYLFFGGKSHEEMKGIYILIFLFGVLYTTATANYFNFMDGINGMAGLAGIIAFSSFGIYGLIEAKDIVWVGIAFCIASACLGFLPMNFPKAKVFMGDVGSILLGFLFAAGVLWVSDSNIEFVVLSTFILPFYFDEISTLIVRIKDRETLTKAHRRHIYQILANQAGMSHTVVTLMYGVFQIISIMIIWLVKGKGIVFLVSFLLFEFGIYFIIGLGVRGRWEGRGIAS